MDFFMVVVDVVWRVWTEWIVDKEERKTGDAVFTLADSFLSKRDFSDFRRKIDGGRQLCRCWLEMSVGLSTNGSMIEERKKDENTKTHHS
jgi:hypothetical protein